jgi:5-methyltetrahydrofolate--homocysteine methyltransferase
MGPTGQILEPIGPLSQADAEAAFSEQAAALVEGGVDVLWIETISSVEELEAAVKGAGATSLPVVVTMSFDTHGRTMMGVTSAQAADLVHSLTPQPLAYGGNCGIGPAETMGAMINLGAARKPDDILIAKSNCGIPEIVEGEIVYSGTPALMADFARVALDAGVRIIGGCCGTTPEHIRIMRDALEAHEPAAPPTLEEVVNRLGPVSKGAERLSALGYLDLSTGEAADSARRRRSRRRGATPTT